MKLSVDQFIAALSTMRAVDLAPRLERGIPRWPSHPHLTIDKAITHDHDGYYCQAIMMAEHTGAHVDAPAHVLPDRMNRTIDTFPAEHLVAAAVLYDFADMDLKPGQLISADDLRRAEQRTGAAVGAGEIAMVNYGWMARYWRTDSKAQWDGRTCPRRSGRLSLGRAWGTCAQQRPTGALRAPDHRRTGAGGGKPR